MPAPSTFVVRSVAGVARKTRGKLLRDRALRRRTFSSKPGASSTPQSSGSSPGSKSLSSSSSNGGRGAQQPLTPSPPSSSSSASSSPSGSFERLQRRLPRFLRRYTEALRGAPASHVAAFLLLHELTAVVPLVGLGAYFYRADTLPAWTQGRWFDDGVARFGRYFRRKGWLGDEEAAGAAAAPSARAKWWARGENGVRLVTSAAAAYALTKMLLPFRLILSVWATPFFARTAVIPITKRFQAFFKRRSS